MELLQKKPLKEQLQFPVDIYVKENGYLGILGFDATQHELFSLLNQLFTVPMQSDLESYF